MKHRIAISISLFFLTVALFAQRTEKVRVEYTFHAPENISLENMSLSAEIWNVRCVPMNVVR